MSKSLKNKFLVHFTKNGKKRNGLVIQVMKFPTPFFSGITSAVFSISGKNPFSKQALTNFESQCEKNILNVFNRNIGMP